MATAKKAVAKKAPATKVPAKKVPVKTAAAKKVPAKKAPGKKAPAKKVPAKKAPAKKSAAKRTLVEPHPGDKRYVRRDDAGHFEESDDVSKSLSQDDRKKAATVAEPGQGDRGDRKPAK